MSEEKTNSIKKTSCEAILNGEKIVVSKLKAGKYYEAQKIYVGMIDKIRQQVGDSKLDKAEGKEKGKEIKESEELESLMAQGSLDINSLYSIFPQEIVKLVSFCVGVETDKLLKDAYPEEIADLATKVIELNNFNQNLKNSIAPLASLGAEK